MASELIFRGHESQHVSDAYSPKPPKPWLSVTRPIRYMLREQRLVFVFVGIAIASLVFAVLPSSDHHHAQISDSYIPSELIRSQPHRSMYQNGHLSTGFGINSVGKIPLGLKRKGLRIVVTGGAGFVGSHLVDRLISRGDSVIVTNVVGTLNMLGLAKRVGARFLLTSTSEVYGDPLQHPKSKLTGETSIRSKLKKCGLMETGVRSCYDEGKRTAETLTMDYHRGANVEVRIARIFNTYGPRMCIDDGRVVSNFVAQALRKEPLTVYGDGKQTRSFQFVSDLVEGLMRLMEGEHIGPFNLGNPGEFTMLELAQVVQETIDPNAKIEFRPNTEDDPHKRKPDITKAKDLLGWEPKVPLRKGLPMMVSDFRQRIFGDHKEEVTSSA
ncbi:hypothetical protein DH2020_046102 [Rehmannia glutinosa]|uniref:UDP-glucuronate decarboxylase n=1 Tax=Rehmannia glutinosa TaxID=99300 RepID=A0ABR0UD04_REHGL